MNKLTSRALGQDFDHTAFPIPPEKLRWMFTGTNDVDLYMESATDFPEQVDSVLRPLGHTLCNFTSILDFGCGAGRLLRNLPSRTQAKLTGVDLVEEAIQFSRKSYPFASFEVASDDPPLPFRDGAFDFLYAISVLTHLDVNRQDRWLKEWHRLVKPGGVLFVTFKPRKEDLWTEEMQQAVDRDGYYFQSTEFWNDYFPSFYNDMFHSPEYVRSHWSRFFSIETIIPEGDLLPQAIAVMRRRESAEEGQKTVTERTSQLVSPNEAEMTNGHAEDDTLIGGGDESNFSAESGAATKVGRHWDDVHQDADHARRDWSVHPAAQQRFHRLLGGQSHVSWFSNQYMSRIQPKRALGIGVGAAGAEIELVAAYPDLHYTLVDLSEAGLAMARSHAAALGIENRIEFRAADAGTMEMEEDEYDLITFMSSLHHIADIDLMLERCARALRPDGILWAWDYVGPDRFAFPPEHVAIAQKEFEGLPAAMKLGDDLAAFHPTVQQVIEADPSEAVHSSRGQEVTRRQFPHFQSQGMYGALMFMIQWGLVPNAAYDDPVSRQAYEALLKRDEELTDSGDLPHYFMHLIGSKSELGGRNNVPQERVCVSNEGHWTDLREYLQGGFNTVQGWCEPRVWDAIEPLVDLIHESGDVGPAIEIGVHHGKFLIGLIKSLQTTEKHIAIDLFSHQSANLDASGCGDQEAFVANLRANGVDPDRIDIRSTDSLSLGVRDTLAINENTGGASLFSVDGCHLDVHTLHDLRFAMSVTRPNGIIFVDDYYNHVWPGVQEGVARLYLSDLPTFLPLVYIANKLFLCHVTRHQEYYETLLTYFRRHHPEHLVVETKRFGHRCLSVEVCYQA